MNHFVKIGAIFDQLQALYPDYYNSLEDGDIDDENELSELIDHAPEDLIQSYLLGYLTAIKKYKAAENLSHKILLNIKKLQNAKQPI
jgi:hypothetical protein